MPEKLKIQTRSLQFAGGQGARLAASLDYPAEQQPVFYAIMSHCFTCTRQTLTTARISRGLAEAGIAVLRFDFTGLGESEGDFEYTHFRSMMQDIESAASFLQQHFAPPEVLLGHSMGGTACLAVSQSGHPGMSQLRKLVTLASPSAPDHVLHHFGEAMAQLEQGQPSSITVAGQSYPVRPSFVSDVRSFDMQAQMENCQLPVLALRAQKDGLVAAGDAQEIVEYGVEGSQLIDIEGADHLFSDREHSKQMIDEVVGWIKG